MAFHEKADIFIYRYSLLPHPKVMERFDFSSIPEAEDFLKNNRFEYAELTVDGDVVGTSIESDDAS